MRTVPRITMWLMGIPCVVVVVLFIVAAGMTLGESETAPHLVAIGFGLSMLPFAVFLLLTLLMRARHTESVIILVGFLVGLAAELLYGLGAGIGFLPTDMSSIVMPVFLWAGCLLTMIAVAAATIGRWLAGRRRG